MKLRDFPLLTDENLDADVVSHLRQLGFDVLDVVGSGLPGAADVDLLRQATAEGRVVEVAFPWRRLPGVPARGTARLECNGPRRDGL